MKLTFLLMLLLTSTAYSKSLVLVSYFDPFGKALTNNSEVVAKALSEKFVMEELDIDLKLCPLQTIYNKAYGQLEDCTKNLAQRPILILGLGESNCDLKIELMMQNKDKSYGPDNSGVERNNSVIISQAPALLGLNYPLSQMYCSLDLKERKSVQISHDAGTFVCNNSAFQMSWYYPEIPYGFIHVPAHNCRRLQQKTALAISQLEKMIISAVEHLKVNAPVRLPVKPQEYTQALAQENKDMCAYEFLKRAKP